MTPMPNPPFAVGATLMSYTVSEFQIVVGVTQMSVEQKGPNAFTLMANPSWQSVLALSPQTAKHLKKQLDDCIAGYESKFGEIQSDPAAAMPTREGSVVSLWPAAAQSNQDHLPERAAVDAPPEPPQPAA